MQFQNILWVIIFLVIISVIGYKSVKWFKKENFDFADFVNSLPNKSSPPPIDTNKPNPPSVSAPPPINCSDIQGITNIAKETVTSIIDAINKMPIPKYISSFENEGGKTYYNTVVKPSFLNQIIEAQTAIAKAAEIKNGALSVIADNLEKIFGTTDVDEEGMRSYTYGIFQTPIISGVSAWFMYINESRGVPTSTILPEIIAAADLSSSIRNQCKPSSTVAPGTEFNSTTYGQSNQATDRESVNQFDTPMISSQQSPA
jgi:hypothetical protein